MNLLLLLLSMNKICAIRMINPLFITAAFMRNKTHNWIIVKGTGVNFTLPWKSFPYQNVSDGIGGVSPSELLHETEIPYSSLIIRLYAHNHEYNINIMSIVIVLSFILPSMLHSKFSLQSPHGFGQWWHLGTQWWTCDLHHWLGRWWTQQLGEPTGLCSFPFNWMDWQNMWHPQHPLPVWSWKLNLHLDEAAIKFHML